MHVLHNGRSLHDGLINVKDQGNQSAFSKSVPLAQGDTLDFVVGFGNGFYGGDTTALAATHLFGRWPGSTTLPLSSRSQQIPTVPGSTVSSRPAPSRTPGH